MQSYGGGGRGACCAKSVLQQPLSWLLRNSTDFDDISCGSVVIVVVASAVVTPPDLKTTSYQTWLHFYCIAKGGVARCCDNTALGAAFGTKYSADGDSPYLAVILARTEDWGGDQALPSTSQQQQCLSYVGPLFLQSYDHGSSVHSSASWALLLAVDRYGQE